MADDDFENLFDEDIEQNLSEIGDSETEISKLIGNVKMSKKNRVELENSVQKYIDNRKDYDYHKYNFNNNILIATDEQFKIITNKIESDMLVLACAGSGKSTTMVCRVKYLIDHGVDPSRIILTTFNVDACESLKIKINCVFGFTPNIILGTFDSIARRLYYRYFKKEYFVGINEYTTELLKYLQSENGAALPHKFDYIVFDEFQDANEFQYQVIKKFYDGGVKVILIGDDAQNIYQWRGSDLKYILHAKDYFSTIETYYLSTNYRSSTEIVAFANNVIKHNKDNIVKPMNSRHGNSNMLPSIKYYYKLNYQSQDVVRTIAMILQNGNAIPDDIAVISRNNYPLKDIEEEFEKYNKDHKTNIKYISLITNESCDAKPKIDIGCVTLTTIHKAKGLEWKYVFLVSCDDDMFPSNLDPVGIQEERRLFYVAITRAKLFLRISFTRKTVSRFIGEIDNSLYVFPNSNKKFFKYSDARSHQTESDLIKVINLLKEDDIDQLRQMGVIPKMIPKIEKIHDGHNYNGAIDQNFLHSDFNNFITRYAIRTLGVQVLTKTQNVDDTKKNMACFSDIYAKTLVTVVMVTRNVYNAYNKYANIIDKYLPTIQITDSNDEILTKLQDPNTKIEPNDRNNVLTLVKFRLDTIEKYGDEYEIFMMPEHYLPDEYLSDLANDYSVYTDTTMKTNDILKTIYKISLCENICNGRRRLIYQDVYNDFIDGYESLFDDIKNSYIPTLPNSNIVCNKHIKALQIELMSDIHILDEQSKSITDIRCSNDQECKLEWLLQLLGKVAILKYMSELYKNAPEKKVFSDINFIKIYNPIQGITLSFDISSWNKHTEMLKYLCNIRNVPYIDPTIVVNKKIDKPIVVSKDNPYYNDLSVINNLIKSYNVMEQPTKQNVKSPVKISDNEQTARHAMFLENTLQLRELLSQYSKSNDALNDIAGQMRRCFREIELITTMKKNKNLKPYYIVFDTETNGLPKDRSNPPAETHLYAYNTARLLQLSWACYDKNGLLIKVDDHYIKPDGYKVAATEIHGITEEIAQNGESFIAVMKKFYPDFKQVKCMIGHNVNFDVNVMKSEMIRRKLTKLKSEFDSVKKICTMRTCKDIAKVMTKQGKIKFPTQTELYNSIMGKQMEDAHNSKYDVLNLGQIVSKLIEDEMITM